MERRARAVHLFPVALCASALLVALACGPSVARISEATITDLSGGRSLTVQLPNLLSGGGKMTAAANDGEQFAGTFAAIPGTPSGQEIVRRVVSAVAWNQGDWALASSLDHIPNREEYTGTLVGDRGTVLDVVFAINTQTIHGVGTAQDNKKNQYKVIL